MAQAKEWVAWVRLPERLTEWAAMERFPSRTDAEFWIELFCTEDGTGNRRPMVSGVVEPAGQKPYPGPQRKKKK